MLVHVKALSSDRKIDFEQSVAVDAAALVAIAAPRQQLARAKGQSFTEGAVSHFAAELLTAARQGQPKSVLEHRTIQLAMAVWLCESVFAGVVQYDFERSNLHFVVQADGMVTYDRLPTA